MKTVVGIIGCGLIADTHVEAIKIAYPEADICVCDPLTGKAELLRKKYNLKRSYTDHLEMLSRENPFSVHILSPPQYHVEHSEKCLEAGCHVLVEKPLAFKVQAVDYLYNLSRKYSCVLCVDHSLFYQPSVLKMLNKIREIAEEQILYVHCFYGLDTGQNPSLIVPEGHWKRGLPGGTIIDTIIHPVTLLVELTGKPKSMVVNLLGSQENSAEMYISWQGESTIASIILSSQAQPFRRVTEVTTNRRTLIVDHSTETFVSLDSGIGPKSMRKLMRNLGHGLQLIGGTIGTGMQVMRGRLKENPGARALIEAFYANLDGRGPLPISEDNVRNSAHVLEEIIEKLVCLTPRRETETKEFRKAAIDRIDDKSIKRTLVTGASGFLGRKVCEQLAKNGRKVVAQVRRGSNADKIPQSDSITNIFEDFKFEPVNYDCLVDGVNEIVHCAHAAGAKTWRQFKRINVDAVVELYDAAAKAGCEKFIFISSVAVYGVHQKRRVAVSEETPTIMGKSKWDFYVRSKILAERLLLDKAKEGGPKLLIIRPGILYSADGTKLARRSIPLKESRMVLVFGNGKNHQPFTRVDMVAETICGAFNLDKFPEGIYNLVGTTDETTTDFVYKRMKNLGIHCQFLRLPAFPLRCLGFMFEFIQNSSFRETMPKFTRYIVDSNTRDIFYDCSKAEKDLGWNSKKAIEV